MDKPWMQNVAFYFGETPITNFAIMRTFLILGLTYLAIQVSSAVWKKLLPVSYTHLTLPTTSRV